MNDTTKREPIHGVRSPLARLKRIVEIIDGIEIRCMAADGPVSNTRHEMSDDELLMIYEIAQGFKVREIARAAVGECAGRFHGSTLRLEGAKIVERVVSRFTTEAK